MTATATTAEQAAAIGNPRNTARLAEIMAVLAEARQDAGLSTYLTWPEIVIGLACGRIGPQGLRRRLDELEANDSGEFAPDEYATAAENQTHNL